MTRCIVCVLLLSAVTFGQAPTTFEVASIRPSSEQVTQVSAGMRVAGSQVRVTGMSLKDYIGMAYGVKPQQIEGPDWLGQQRFDLAATIPAGGSAAQLGDMLQALLADRFKMTMHREKKEFPVYALGVAKGGAKLQPSAATPEAAAREKAPEVNVAAGGSNAGVGADLGGGSVHARQQSSRSEKTDDDRFCRSADSIRRSSSHRSTGSPVTTTSPSSSRPRTTCRS